MLVNTAMKKRREEAVLVRDEKILFLKSTIILQSGKKNDC